MNIYSIVGLLMAAVVFVAGILMASDNIEMFVDFPAMFIIFGGTLASTAISFQIDRVFVMLKVFFNRVIKGKRYNYQHLIKEIITISEAYRKGESFESLQKRTHDYFFREGLEMASDGILPGKDILQVLSERVKHLNYAYTEEALKFKSMGKYPPAFGLLGTTIGMVVLLSNLGGADALKRIGPAMGLCLIATLYGCAFANMVIIPIGENIVESTKETHLKNKIILEGMKLLLEKTNPIIVAEKLNSFLPPADRLDWKKVLGK